VRLAAADAGLALGDIDGLLTSSGRSHHHRGLPRLAVDSRAVSPARLLPYLQRGHRGHRHHRGPGRGTAAATGLGTRLGAGASRSLRPPV
jgi:hypothetical protein